MKQTNHKIWRISSVLTLILCLFVSSSKAQAPQPAITGGRLINFPLNEQLYPRNLITNQATASFSIRMRVSGSQYNRLRLVIYRDLNNNENYFDDAVPYNGVIPYSSGTVVGDSVTINFPNYSIFAELRQYAFVLWGITPGNVEVQLNVVTGVVAGDAFIIQGQSNSYAEKRNIPEESNALNSTFRRFVKSYGSSDPRGSDFYTRSWGRGDGDGNNFASYNVGMWGMRLGARIAQTESIPVAIFCGGFGDKIPIFQANSGTYISSDGDNNYRRLRRRLAEAGVQNFVRGIFWWQGESDGIIDNNKTSRTDYVNTFNTILTSWRADYPALEKVFIIQIRLGCYVGAPPVNSALEVMQAQLDLAKQHNDVEIFSSQNLDHIFETGGGIPAPGWYCHYGYTNGYEKAANNFLPTVRQELYGEPILPNSRTPFPIAADVTSTTPQPTQVTIEMSEPLDVLSIVPLTGNNIRDYFRLEGGTYTINSVEVQNNLVRVNFTNNSNNTPEFVSYFGRQQFGAPVIENSGGHAVVAFTQPIVGGSLPIDPLLLTVSRTGGAHQLRWKAESNERFDQFVVERGETRNSFKPIYEVYGTGQSGTIQYDFTDNKPNATVSHYRIRAIQQDGREMFSQVVTVNNRLNSVKEFRVYPNPVAGSANATINMNEAALATINLHDASGRLLTSRKLQLQKGNNQFSLGELLDYNPGTYIVRVVTATETQQIRVVKAK